MNENFYPPQQQMGPPTRQMELPLQMEQEISRILNFNRPMVPKPQEEPDGWVPSPMDRYLTNQEKLKDFWGNFQQIRSMNDEEG